jgi:aminoglycoside phosphotransferase (APT) family kinase protein
VDSAPQQLGGGGRFVVTSADGVVTKVGDPRALAREAAGLRAGAGSPVVPRLVDAHRGVIRTRLIDGDGRDLRGLSATDAHTLGDAVRTLHEHRRSATAGLSGWSARVRSLAAYRRRRAADAIHASGPDRALAQRIAARLPDVTTKPNTRPFHLLHGDLAASNIVWAPRPCFVDFEFWRMGDPAEDLAYLIEVNELPRHVTDAVLHGYGVEAVLARVEGWRAMCALDAGLWYRAAGDEALAEALVSRAARLCDLPQGGGITGDVSSADNP